MGVVLRVRVCFILFLTGPWLYKPQTLYYMFYFSIHSPPVRPALDPLNLSTQKMAKMLQFFKDDTLL